MANQTVQPTEEQVQQAVKAVNAFRAEPGAHVQRGAFEAAIVRSLQGGQPTLENAVTQLLNSLHQFHTIPDVVTVHASRRVESAQNLDEDDHGWLVGRGLIKELAALQNPSVENWEEGRAKWRAITAFTQHVLDDRDAFINVPHDTSTIQIETPRRVLPLESLGSGIEQVVVLAAAATVKDNTLICMEEPETNLHPLLQKKLVRYLSNATSNQYLIATHSAHFLDYERASVYHLQLEDAGTRITNSRKPNELVALCNDLGYRPSDLMQANCVIWVEGPADRTYISTWLRLHDPNLKEGIHYKIMSYGGSLVSHLTADDAALDAFINLRKLNRASVIVMDSDKTSARKPLKPAVARIKQEFAGGGWGHAWITDGYTIENYIPHVTLAAAVKAVHPSQMVFPAYGKWDNPFAGRTVRKEAVAKKAAAMLTRADLNSTPHLKKQVKTLATFIREANANAVVTDTHVTSGQEDREQHSDD